MDNGRRRAKVKLLFEEEAEEAENLRKVGHGSLAAQQRIQAARKAEAEQLKNTKNRLKKGCRAQGSVDIRGRGE
jgi:hypothetical protein